MKEEIKIRLHNNESRSDLYIIHLRYKPFMGVHTYSMPASVTIEAVAKAPMLEDDISNMSVGSCHLCNGSSIVDDLRHILIHEDIPKFLYNLEWFSAYMHSDVRVLKRVTSFCVRART
jgi:hypothetical protein